MEKKEQCVVMDWYIGSYSGTWREWKGRDQGKSVVFFSQTIENSDILKTVSFTKAMRLNPQTVKDLKCIYSTIQDTCVAANSRCMYLYVIQQLHKELWEIF